MFQSFQRTTALANGFLIELIDIYYIPGGDAVNKKRPGESPESLGLNVQAHSLTTTAAPALKKDAVEAHILRG